MPGGYKTRQKETILEYFTAHEGEHVTAAQVVDHLRRTGAPTVWNGWKMRESCASM